MKRPALSASEENPNPVLIVDRKGILGIEIAKELSQELLVVLSTEKNTGDLDNKNIILVPYLRKFPTIPDNVYSNIIIFDEEDEGIKESISVFIKKADKDKASLVYVSPISEISQNLAEKILHSYKKSKAIIYGDIFGEGNALEFDNPLNYIISQVARSGKIKIPGEGLIETFPVFFSDALEKILSAIFGTSKNEVFFLFPRHPKNLISVAHIFQKKDPSVTTDFTKEKKFIKERKINITGEYLLDENYDVDRKIKNLNLDFEYIPKENEFKKEDFKEPKEKRSFIPYFLFFTSILLIPALATFIFLGLGILQLEAIKKDFNRNDFAGINSSLILSQNLLNVALATNKILEKELSFVGLSRVSNDITFKIETAKNLIEAGSEIAKVSSLSQSILNGKSKDPRRDSLLAVSSFRKSSGIINQVKLTGGLDKNISDKLDKYEPILNSFSQISNLSYQLLNPDGKKTYLVLFQNNMELRPGGGFIGSYGILSFDKGKILDFTIHDVYDADGQLKTHVEPPFPIRRYIPLVHWYLRDSNFDVDFTKSASSAANFLHLETGQVIDGVISVDVTFVRDLIGALGEIEVPEYKEKINEHNFYKITQAHVEKDFFPGSTQKKDFLSALFNAIKNNLSERKNLPYGGILKAISTAMTEKHMLFAFSDESIQSVFSASGWSSRLNDHRENTQLNDFLGVNEANLGVNKANFFIGRSIRYEADIRDDGGIDSKATLSIKNDSKEWPGGDYKTYLRFIVPQGAILSSISIDGEEKRLINAVTDPRIYESKNFTPPAGLEVETYEENGKTVFGFLTIIPAGKSQKIVVSYTLPKRVPIKSTLSVYSLRFFKQPGTDTTPFDFILSYPPSVDVKTSKEYNVVDGKIVISKTLFSDETMDFDISRK